MPSTLQVDKIIDGSATTNKELAEYASGNWSWGSGVPSGSVLQVQFNEASASQTIDDGTAKIVDKTFNRKKGNSYFLVQAVAVLGPTSDAANKDTTDPVLYYKVNDTVFDSGSGYISHTSQAAPLKAWYASTVPDWHSSGDYSGTYDVHFYTNQKLFTGYASGSDNDSIKFAVWGDAHTQGMKVNKANAGANSGAFSNITIWEIAQ